MSDGVLIDDVLIRTGSMTSRMIALKQRVVRLALSDTKHVVYVVEFEEGVEEREYENLVEDRHTAPIMESEKRCLLQIVASTKQYRGNSVILICTTTKSTQSQQRISDTQKQINFVLALVASKDTPKMS